MKFNIKGMDFSRAGEASGKIKKSLQLVGMEIDTVRRAVIVAYEAEMNVVIHARRGKLTAHIRPDRVEIVAEDEGPGIADLTLAFQEGYSTAPPHVREMGFGAGMGLPNIRRFSDELNIDSQVDVGTKLQATINNQTSGE